MRHLLNFTVDMSGFDPSKRYMHEFDTVSEFDEAYNGEAYEEPWVSAVREDEGVALRL